jgi:hypothetical protein
MIAEKTIPAIELTEEQKREGFWIEILEDRVLVWHKKNQLALLLASPDIQERVQEFIQRKRQEFKELEAKTGYKID